MILILTHSKDVSADFVIRHLHNERRQYIRLDTDLLGTPDCFFGYHREPELYVRGKLVRASDVSAIWARRFALPNVLRTIKAEYVDFARREFAAVMDAFLEMSKDTYCINPSYADKLAGNRLIQAQRARELGFLVPDSLATQNVGAAQKFLNEHPGTITKAISFGRLSVQEKNEKVAFASVVSKDTQPEKLESCPSLFQQMVPKAFDWRVTTVGERLFAAKIKYDDGSAAIDWRDDDNAAKKFFQCELPKDFANRLRQLCEKSQIIYGTHDLIETPTGDFYFLETNPAGQWAWLEVALGMPIGKAIAEELVSHQAIKGRRQ